MLPIVGLIAIVVIVLFIAFAAKRNTGVKTSKIAEQADNFGNEPQVVW